jgi:hypothetical protein
MDLARLMEICKAYNKLGWAVQDQLHDVLENKNYDDQNRNALELIKDFLNDASDVCEDASTEVSGIIDFLQSDEENDPFDTVRDRARDDRDIHGLGSERYDHSKDFE